MLTLGKFSVGVGDRFAHQARAQLRACQLAGAAGAEVIPVWNKSNREHTIIGSEPTATRAAADDAVKALGWKKPYHVDADHIRLETVERFLPSCDFYTIDVADSIGQPALAGAVKIFSARHPELLGTVAIPGVSEPFTTTPADVERIVGKYLKAVKDAGAIYNKITWIKGRDNFITEVSMDETDAPQTPQELLLILAALADENVPLQTIAPKFTGRFNKGVDYVGDLAQFEKEFRDDLAVLAFAVKKFRLPANLKLSVHSGSDKFSLYPIINRALRDTGAGLHLKTAGTRRRRSRAGEADLLEGAREERRTLRAVRHGNRHQSGRPAGRRNGERLDRGAVHRGAAARPGAPAVQPVAAAARSRRVQGGGATRRSVPRDAAQVRNRNRAQRDREPLRPPPETAVYW
jgi:tagaturonate epimerase